MVFGVRIRILVGCFFAGVVCFDGTYLLIWILCQVVAKEPVSHYGITAAAFLVTVLAICSASIEYRRRAVSLQPNVRSATSVGAYTMIFLVTSQVGVLAATVVMCLLGGV